MATLSSLVSPAAGVCQVPGSGVCCLRCACQVSGVYPMCAVCVRERCACVCERGVPGRSVVCCVLLVCGIHTSSGYQI